MDACVGSREFLHRCDLVGHKAVSLTVHRGRRLGVGRLDQTEDLAGRFIEPPLDVVHPVLGLHLEIAFVCPARGPRR